MKQFQRIVQISATPKVVHPDSGRTVEPQLLYALTQEGEIYCFVPELGKKAAWAKIPPIFKDDGAGYVADGEPRVNEDLEDVPF